MNDGFISASENSGASFGLIIYLVAGILSLLTLVFWVWMLIDCVRNETDAGEKRLWWSLGIALTHVLGAGLYFLFRKLPRRHGVSESASESH